MRDSSDFSDEGSFALPSSWAWVKLGDLQPEFQNGLASRGGPAGSPTVVLRLADISNGRISLLSPRSLSLTEVSRSRYTATDTDVLVIRVNGSTDLVGQFIPCNERDIVYCDHFIRMRVQPELIDQRFLVLLGTSWIVRRQIERFFVSTAGQKTVNQRHISSVVLPLPPRLEQDRIVAAIDEQFSRLDAGVAALERVRQNLRRLREAVLHRVIGFGLDVKLPTGWEWVTIGDIAGQHSTPVLTGPFGTSLSRSDFQSDGIPVLTIGCLTSGGIRTELAPRVSEAKAKTLRRYALEPGDVLFSRMATVGRAAAVTEKEAGSLINYHLMRLRLDQEMLLPEFLVLLCRGSRAIDQYLSESNHGVTRPGINTKQLLGLPVALPPLNEQEDVVNVVRYADDVASQLEREVALATARAGRLRSSVLAAAFSGRLVSQSLTGEPAPVLLERIEKASLNGRKSARSRKA